MLWRSLSLVRAWSAAGLLSVVSAGLVHAGDPSEPVPSRDSVSETIKVLDGQKSGDLAIEARGRGQSQVHLSIRNTSKKKLNVVLPPGLVAASGVGQLQSMGLGSPKNRPGGFGQFSGGDAGGVGFRSVAILLLGLTRSRSRPARRSTSNCRPSA